MFSYRGSTDRVVVPHGIPLSDRIKRHLVGVSPLGLIGRVPVEIIVHGLIVRHRAFLNHVHVEVIRVLGHLAAGVHAADIPSALIPVLSSLPGAQLPLQVELQRASGVSWGHIGRNIIDILQILLSYDRVAHVVLVISHLRSGELCPRLLI